MRVQAQIAAIGEQMGMSIWIPRADRTGVTTLSFTRNINNTNHN
jgi:hypothetical protein